MHRPLRLPFARFAAPLAVIALLAVLPRGAGAQVWTETGDAGTLVATAQHTTGTGPLTTILGTFADSNDVDVYCIHVTSPAGFFAGIQCAVMFDPNIWLFDAAGTGLTMQDNCQFGYASITGLHVPGPGTYYLTVAPEGRQAASPGGPIWLTSVFNPTERVPDAIGAPGPLVGWVGTGLLYPFSANYHVTLAGAEFCDAPTPALHRTWGELKSIYR